MLKFTSKVWSHHGWLNFKQVWSYNFFWCHRHRFIFLFWFASQILMPTAATAAAAVTASTTKNFIHAFDFFLERLIAQVVLLSYAWLFFYIVCIAKCARCRNKHDTQPNWFLGTCVLRICNFVRLFWFHYAKLAGAFANFVRWHFAVCLWQCS